MVIKGTFPDPRTTGQKQVDEAVASGDWDGLEVEVQMNEKDAHHILDRQQGLNPGRNPAVNGTPASLRFQPFRWKDKVFRILRCDYVDGQSFVEAVPTDSEFVSELKRRLDENPFHTLTYYQGFGFISFPEDYEKHRH